jgi:hypothetical protein
MPSTTIIKHSLRDHLVKDGIGGGVDWFLDRFRRVMVTLVPTTVIVLGAVILSGYLNVKAGNFLSSGIAADIITKVVVGAIEFAFVVFALFLMYAMYAALIYVVPLFSVEIPKFEPRAGPDESKGETWEGWLYKGVRGGRWRGPSGSREPGGIARIPILDEHLIIGAITRHGKSMMLWTIIYELLPAILAGAVELIIFDPKSGMELYAAVKLGWCKPEHFHHGQGANDGTDGRPAVTVEQSNLIALQGYVRHMRRQGDQIMGKDQRHHAKPGRSHRVLIIDEGASMVRASTDMVTRRAIIGCIEDLCQMGAAAGYTVIVATQHPDIRQIPFRHSLTYGLCGRVKTWQASEMLLGEGSYAKGARGDKLPRRLKGTWYTSQTGAWVMRGCKIDVKFVPKKPPEPETEEPTNAELAAAAVPSNVRFLDRWRRKAA